MCWVQTPQEGLLVGNGEGALPLLCCCLWLERIAKPDEGEGDQDQRCAPEVRFELREEGRV